MNREILFRGKRLDGTWAEGYYVFNGETHGIVDSRVFPGSWSEVDPATIGQYTGLTDRKGNKVFEGDIVKGGIYTAYEIKWDSYRAEFNTGAAGLSVSEVIGTIHDTHLTKQS